MTYQPVPQYQPRYGFRYIKRPNPAPSLGPPLGTMDAQQPPPVMVPNNQPPVQHESSGENHQAPEGPRYASFGDAFETISGGENRRLDQGYQPPEGQQTSTSQRNLLGGLGGAFLGSKLGGGPGALVGGAIGSGLIPIPFVGSAIGSAIGGAFDEQVPEPEAAPENFVDSLSPEQEQVRQEAIATNQQLQQERDDDHHRDAAYSGTTRASGSSASSGGRGGRRGGGSSPAPDTGNREGSGTGGQARSGEYVSSSHDWSAPAQRDDSDSGGGGGGGGK